MASSKYQTKIEQEKDVLSTYTATVYKLGDEPGVTEQVVTATGFPASGFAQVWSIYQVDMLEANDLIQAAKVAYRNARREAARVARISDATVSGIAIATEEQEEADDSTEAPEAPTGDSVPAEAPKRRGRPRTTTAKVQAGAGGAS